MEWIDSITKVVDYIEKNLTEELTVDRIATHVQISPFHFQRGFSMLCGFTVGDYIRRRRLAQAASELISTQEKVMDTQSYYSPLDAPDLGLTFELQKGIKTDNYITLMYGYSYKMEASTLTVRERDLALAGVSNDM